MRKTNCHRKKGQDGNVKDHLELVPDILATTLTASASPSASPKEASSPKEGAEEVIGPAHASLRESLLAVLVVQLPLLRVGEDVVGTTYPK